MIFLVSAGIAIIKPNAPLLSRKDLALIILLFCIPIASSIINVIIAPMIYFPIIGITFSLIMRRHPHLLLYSLYYALLIHIICGIFLDALAFVGIQTSHVSPFVKGFSFLFSPHGFTTTVQTFGTLCIIWLMLFLLREKLKINTYIDNLFFVINTIAIIATFSRSTLILWMIVLFFKKPKLFWTIILFLCAFMIRFWYEIFAFITSSGSLVSRSELLEGFDISFIQSHSILVYVFGRGTNQLSSEIVEKVKWFTRSDFENGYAMLLHSYGSIGLLVYITLCFSFIFQFFKMKRFGEACILFFYFFITQYFTQEFVSVTFYFFVAVMFLFHDTYVKEIKSRINNR